LETINQRLNKELEKRVKENSLRRLSLPGNLIDFYSNDYLGLSRNKDLHQKITLESKKHPANGATGSRLLSGYNKLYEETELFLSRIFLSEASLIFNSGYSANTAILSAIPKKDDVIIYDELAHACIKDGARLSLAKRYSFKHNNLNDLENKLQKHSTGLKFVVVESIYSMDGDECRLQEVIQLTKKHNAHVIIDEAHTTGVLGEHGSGLSTSLRLQDDIFTRIYTFGKAMGIHGAAIACSKTLKSYLINFARPFIYTTALPPHSIISIKESFTFLSENINLQESLKSKVTLFNDLFSEKLSGKYTKIDSSHPIQSIIVPGNDNVKAITTQLSKNGFDARPILSPTVKKDTERLRICLHTFNSDKEISALIDTLAK